MTAGLPARLSTTELMPPEDHLRPGRLSRFWLVYLLLVSSMTLAIVLLLWVPGFGGLSFVLSLGVIFGTLGVRRGATRANEKNQRGINLLNAGEIETAGEMFEQLARKRRFTYGHVVFVYNCAVAALLQGRHQRALSIFNAVEASGQLRRRFLRPLEPNLYIEMGCCLALTGDLSEARKYLSRAATLLQPPEDGRLLFLEAVIAVRSGDHAAACARIDEQWRRAEGSLRGPTIRTLRLVHAYALSQTGRRDTDKFRTLVAGAQPATRDDFHWSTLHWPEFGEFVTQVIPA